MTPCITYLKCLFLKSNFVFMFEDNVLSHPRTRTPSRSTTASKRTPRGTTTTSRKKNIIKEPEPSTSNGLTSAFSTITDIAGDTDGSVSSTTGESIRGNEEILLDPECSPQEFPLDSKRKTSQQKQVKSTIKKSKKGKFMLCFILCQCIYGVLYAYQILLSTPSVEYRICIFYLFN